MFGFEGTPALLRIAKHENRIDPLSCGSYGVSSHASNPAFAGDLSTRDVFRSDMSSREAEVVLRPPSRACYESLHQPPSCRFSRILTTCVIYGAFTYTTGCMTLDTFHWVHVFLAQTAKHRTMRKYRAEAVTPQRQSCPPRQSYRHTTPLLHMAKDAAKAHLASR